MDELAWPDLDNSTEYFEDGNATPRATVAMSTAGRHAPKQSVSAEVVAAVGVAIMSVGIVANSGVLACLLYTSDAADE